VDRLFGNLPEGQNTCCNEYLVPASKYMKGAPPYDT
jgi:hypothetical protein